ncbi:MAG: hypothetical protein IJ600_01880 [Lachnospiraceae bacterium]|nr:hypothetical protein [Lachnospiraceae bacterium]
MPKYIEYGKLSDLLTNMNNLFALMPETEDQKDSGEKSLEELQTELLQLYAGCKGERKTLEGGRVSVLLSEEEAEKVMPVIKAIGERCREYLNKPGYSAAERPVLNAYLRDFALEVDMMDAGLDLEAVWNRQGAAGYASHLTLMDLKMPDTKGMDPEWRREALDAYEKSAVDGPLLKLIHQGLDQMQLAGEYQIALDQAAENKTPLQQDVRDDFNTRMRQGNAVLEKDILAVEEFVRDKDEVLKKNLPYMNSTVVDNFHMSRGLATQKNLITRENALLDAGFSMEEYYDVFGMEASGKTISANFNQFRIPESIEQQTHPGMSQFMTMYFMAKDMMQGLEENPEKLKGLKETLKKDGISLPAYNQALHAEMLDLTGKLVEDKTLGEPEKKFIERCKTVLERDKGYFKKTVGKNALDQVRDKIRPEIQKRADEVFQAHHDPLDDEVKQAGLGAPENWRAPDVQKEPLTLMDITNLMGAATKMAGILEDGKGSGFFERFTTAGEYARNNIRTAYTYFNAAVISYRFEKTQQVENMDGELVEVHPEQEMVSILKDMNSAASEKLKSLPETSHLQRTMLEYVEKKSREALDHDGMGIEQGKDAMEGYANGLWANITEPGHGKNLKWPEAEALNEKFGFHHLMKDSMDMHEIFVNSSKRSHAGISDPEKEKAERELYGKLLNRFEATAERILHSTEDEKKEIAGLFDATNAENTVVDLFGNRGVKLAANTARLYREGLDKGWPIHEIPTYAALHNYVSKIKEKTDGWEDVRLNAIKGRVAKLEEALEKGDILSLNEKEKADFFKGISDTLKEVNVERQAVEKAFKPRLQTLKMLEADWPTDKIPKTYADMLKYQETMQNELGGMEGGDLKDIKDGIAKLDTALKEHLEDIRSLDPVETEGYMAELSGIISGINKERGRLKENVEVFGKEEIITGVGAGNLVNLEALEDVLTLAAQNSMKSAVNQGLEHPEALQGLMTRQQKDSIEDAQIAANKATEAFKLVSERLADYKEMYKQLKGLKKEGHEDSEYFQDMEKALKGLAEMDAGKNTPQQFIDAFDTLQKASREYADQRGGFFSAWRSNGKQRKDLAEKLSVMAEADNGAFKGIVEKDDALENPESATKFQEKSMEVRDTTRGPLRLDEPLIDQLQHHVDAIERNRIPKMEDVRQKKENAAEKEKKNLEKQNQKKKEEEHKKKVDESKDKRVEKKEAGSENNMMK